ncbi:hypothetical protein ABMA28_011457 [Loxostege sticticalis]|uniref:SET domain-containing protein n=1 Tax=Loxostege sticticalis TaxID=481309 RepID=A0ABD0S591_LOXSC
MSEMKLRTKIPINYYEPEEPSFDKYIYCDHCRDFVYEYCSLHGPLLVIPDDEVPPRTDYSPFVPHAALTVPSEFLHIAPSIIPGAGLGVFATVTLPSGVRFGPFCGRRTKHITSQYCWKIQDSNMRFNYAIDASDANSSNWMRYVNCARHWHEQNLVAYQYRGQIYYRTIKLIPRFTELMVFYGSECAMTLNIDMRNYNSDDFCQKIAYRKSNEGKLFLAIIKSDFWLQFSYSSKSVQL